MLYFVLEVVLPGAFSFSATNYSDVVIVNDGTNSFEKALKICNLCSAHLTIPAATSEYIASKFFWTATYLTRKSNSLQISPQLSHTQEINVPKVLPVKQRNPLFLLDNQCFAQRPGRDELLQRMCQLNSRFVCESNDRVPGICEVKDACADVSGVAQKTCLESSSSLYDPGVLLSRGTRIINGKNALIQDHPWAVYLKYQHKDAPDKWSKCAGVIVSSKRMITAKHCLVNAAHGVVYWGSANSTKMTRTKYQKQQSFNTNFIKLHPDKKIDIAALNFEMAEPFINTEVNNPRPSVLPIKLPKKGQVVNPKDLVTVIGWGATCTDPPQCTRQDGNPTILQEVNIRAEGPHNCDADLHQFCAGGIYNGMKMDACKGDSGAPVECINSDGTKRLCGIVSTGPDVPKCGTSPGTYVQVADEDVLWFVENKNRSGTAAASQPIRSNYVVLSFGIFAVFPYFS